MAICGRTAHTLEAAAKEIRESTGAEVLAQVVDVTSEAQVRNSSPIRATVSGAWTSAWRTPEALRQRPFDQTTVAEWEAAVQLNLMSTLYLVREVLPEMREQKWGR